MDEVKDCGLSRPLDEETVMRMLWALYQEVICPAERDCWLALNDPRFRAYWASVESEEDRQVVEEHIAQCQWCALEKEERDLIKRNGDPLPVISMSQLWAWTQDPVRAYMGTE